MHLILGYSVDQINNFILNLSLKGISKLKLHCVKKANAITPEILYKIGLMLDMSNTDNIVFWCLFLFAFFLLARKSNLVPATKNEYLARKFLLRQNITDHGSYLTVTFYWTKTIQSGERILELPLVEIENSILCPVQAYRKLCQVIPASKDSPLFMFANGKVVSYYQFQRKLRLCIEQIGLQPELFSTHSFRRGGASLAFRAKISSDKIKLLGDWKSDCYREYLAFDFEDKLLVCKDIKKHLLEQPFVSSTLSHVQ